MPAFKPFVQYFATGSDTAPCQDYEEYEIVECLSEEIQIIDLFKHCKLQPHTCKLSQYTLATRLRFGNFRILFDNMKNEKWICKLQNLFSKTASVQTKTFVPCRCDIFRFFEFMLLGNRPFLHSCKQRFQVKAWVDKIQ